MFNFKLIYLTFSVFNVNLVLMAITPIYLKVKNLYFFQFLTLKYFVWKIYLNK